jgi:hypothetical protein
MHGASALLAVSPLFEGLSASLMLRLEPALDESNGGEIRYGSILRAVLWLGEHT